MRYVGLEKLGRGMALQGIKMCEENGRRWQTSGQIVVVPGQVFDTDLDMGSWVKDGYLADAPIPKPIVAPVPVVEPKPIVVAPVVVPVVLPKPVEPVPVVVPKEEIPVVVEKEPEVKSEPEPETKVESKPVEKSKSKPETKPEPDPKKGRFGRKK